MKRRNHLNQKNQQNSQNRLLLDLGLFVGCVFALCRLQLYGPLAVRSQNKPFYLPVASITRVVDVDNKNVSSSSYQRLGTLNVKDSTISGLENLHKNQPLQKVCLQESKANTNLIVKGVSWIDSIALGGNLSFEYIKSLEKRQIEIPPDLKNVICSELPENLDKIHSKIPEHTDKVVDSWAEEGKEYLESLSETRQSTLLEAKLIGFEFTRFKDLGKRDISNLSGLSGRTIDATRPVVLLTKKRLKKLIEVNNRRSQDQLNYDLEQQKVNLFQERDQSARFFKHVGETVVETREKVKTAKTTFETFSNTFSTNEKLVFNADFSSRIVLYTKPVLSPLKGVVSYDFSKSNLLFGVGKNKFIPVSCSSSHLGLILGVYYGHTFHISPVTPHFSYIGCGFNAFCGIGLSF